MKPKFLSLLLIPTSAAFAADGTWTNTASSSWNTPATNWSGSVVANGADFTAFFNTLDLTADIAVNMGGSRTIGHLNFGDTNTTTAAGWSLTGSSATLTLSVTSGTPTITVGALGGTKSAIISTNISSTGFTKLGAGILDLQPGGAGGNSISGTTTISAGSIYFRNANAFGGGGSIALDGTATELRNTSTAVTLSNNITIGATGNDKTLTTTVTGTIFSGNITINEETSGNFIVNPQGSNIMTISGDIAGTGGAGLKKTGTTSFLVLSGSNTYTGDTQISGGTLRAGSANAIPNGAGKGNVAITGSAILDLNGNSITINGLSGSTGSVENNVAGTATLTLGAGDADGSTYSSTIRDNNGTGGTLALAKTGTGTQTLGGSSSSYSGGTIIQSGRINASASGALGSGVVQLNGTEAQLRLSSNGVSLANSLTITDTGNNKTLSGFAVGGSTNYTGAITINETTAGNFTVQAGDSHTLTVSGNISGTGGAGLKKTSAGTVTLSGNNSYAGPTAINQGTVNANSTTALGNATNSLTLANLNTGAGSTTTLNVGASLTTGTLSSAAMATPSSGTNGIQINIQSGNTLTVNQSVDASYAGQITGSGQFALGSGSTNKLILTGNNTYSGSTTLNAGTLLVNGSLGDTAVTVGSGATLGGSGTIGTGAVLNTVTVNGTLGPGNSPGLLTINDNLAFGSGGVLMMQLEGTIAGTGYDQVILNGAGSLAGTLSLAWNLLSTASDGTILTLISNDGSDAFTGSFNYAEGATVTDNLGGSWTLSYLGNSGNDLILTAVPEPAAALLGGLGMLMLLRRRR